MAKPRLLGGLISELDRKTASKVPGLGQLPVLGRLFSNNNSNTLKTEIILSITPRIVRSVATADASLRDIYSGTESSMKQAPLRLDPVGAAGGAPAVVSGTGLGVSGGAAPGGPSQAPSASGRTYRPMPGTGGAPGAAPAADPAAGSDVSAGVAPAAMPGSEASPPASAEPAAPLPSDAPTEPSPSMAPAPTTSVPASTSVASTSEMSTPAAAAATAAAATATAAGANAMATGPGLPAVVLNGPPSVRVGEEFDVVIDGTIPGSLSNLSLVIRFDPKVLAFMGAIPAELARRSGIDSAAPGGDPNGGRVELDLRPAAGTPLSGQGTLLNLRFAARTARGQTTIAAAQANVPTSVDARATPKSSLLRVRVGP